ncbi:MAG TPA: DUF192 domain-containing protein [Acidimicrobiales bacterium]|jgi:hypothetical protein|nr:DUF192 domain-containing protein [Acidimicrobiales bacterium]
MAWLLREGDVLAALELADGFGARLKGLIGRDGLEGALLIQPAKAVHTMGMRFPIDVAFCDRDLLVLRTLCLKQGRVSLPRLKAHGVIEAEAGAFERWQLRPGDRLEVKG